MLFPTAGNNDKVHRNPFCVNLGLFPAFLNKKFLLPLFSSLSITLIAFPVASVCGVYKKTIESSNM